FVVFISYLQVDRPELHDIEPLHIPGVELKRLSEANSPKGGKMLKLKYEAGLVVCLLMTNYMYYSFTENEDKKFLRKCEHNGTFVCDVSLPKFVRGIGKDNNGF
ncbi:hypothetical protein GBAR_LOCUS24278, partial [Geodia barretti]